MTSVAMVKSPVSCHSGILQETPHVRMTESIWDREENSHVDDGATTAQDELEQTHSIGLRKNLDFALSPTDNTEGS